MITSFKALSDSVANAGKRKILVAANATDEHTLLSIVRAVKAGFVEAFLVGNAAEIEPVEGLKSEFIHIIDVADKTAAAEKAVAMVRGGEADILMKGLMNTDVLLKAVLNKERGILQAGNVLSHVGVLEIPKYHKLLFFTDAAVIPSPTLEQRTAQIKYAVRAAKSFGIAQPKIALLHASEKPSPKIQYTQDYLAILEMHRSGEFGDVVIDAPLDMSLSIDPESVEIKGVATPVNGDADILVFPNIESANCFYKAMTHFAEAKMAGILQGTDKPVILMSRSETAESKFYSIAMACL
ncbi:MAG: phosphate butyryltransferase [Prevotellaceae bacterium]|jgi:phosphate butyryltransferase|nr:phosphate butyryltransferase [Prevotellaceae bacterium]